MPFLPLIVGDRHKSWASCGSDSSSSSGSRLSSYFTSYQMSLLRREPGWGLSVWGLIRNKVVDG